jgi:hypothetical protein
VYVEVYVEEGCGGVEFASIDEVVVRLASKRERWRKEGEEGQRERGKAR